MTPPFLAVELDAIKKIAPAARLAQVSEHQLGWGLVCLWQWCRQQGSDVATVDHLEAFIGGDGPRLVRALVAFRFAEQLPDGSVRVKGADRLLRIASSKAEGGKARAANAERDEKGRLLPQQKPSSEPADVQQAPSRNPALTPNTQHPSPNTQKKERENAPQAALTLSPAEPEGQGEDSARAVFDHWVQVRQLRHAKFTRDRERKVRARLAEGYSVDELKRAVDGNAASEWHREKQQHDLELICRDGAHVDRFIREAEQAGPPSPPPELTQPDTPAGEAWATALERLRAEGLTYGVRQIQQARFEAVDLRGAELVLRVPNPHAAEWLRQNYGGAIREALEAEGLSLVLTADEEQPTEAA